MTIKYKKSAVSWNILMQYFGLFSILVLMVFNTHYNLISAISFFIAILIVYILYKRTITKINNILQWHTKKVRVDLVTLIGQENAGTSSMIESIEFIDNKQVLKAINLESLFFPISKPKENIMEESIDLKNYQLDDLLIYRNENNLNENYFNDDIEYYLSSLRKIVIGMELFLVIYFLYNLFRLSF